MAETSRIGFADLSGTTRLILVGGIVVAILLAGFLTYRAYRRIPRKAYDAKASKGLFDAPREMNRLLIEAQQDGVLWDPLGQRLAYFVVLAGIAGVCLADLASGGRWSRRWIEGKTRLAFWALMAGLCLIPKLLEPIGAAIFSGSLPRLVHGWVGVSIRPLDAAAGVATDVRHLPRSADCGGFGTRNRHEI